MKISIQQPEFFPWPGYIDKMLQVDKVVFLDNVQFKKRYFENRNKIRTYQGWSWINVPVKSKGRYTQNIMDVEIDNSLPWQRKLYSTLEFNYKKAPYWEDLGLCIDNILRGKYSKLVDLNMSVIKLFMDKFKITREWAMASSLDVESSGSDLILEICSKVGAAEYLSGRDGKNYLNEKDFKDKGIQVQYQDFTFPEYSQLHGDFIPGMSVIDMYMNHGPESVELIRGK